jgi:hypothetical protein
VSKREVWVIELYQQTAIDGTKNWEANGQAFWHSEYAALAAKNKLPINQIMLRVVRYVPAPAKPKRRKRK